MTGYLRLLSATWYSYILIHWNGNVIFVTLQWHHNEGDGVSNHRRLHCLLNRLLRHRSNKTSKLCVVGLCYGNPPVTSGFPSQRASYAETVYIWWHLHEIFITKRCDFDNFRCSLWWGFHQNDNPSISVYIKTFVPGVLLNGGISNYIFSWLWDIITVLCPSYLLLAPKSLCIDAMWWRYASECRDIYKLFWCHTI